jgi:hypothetical protein
MFVVVAAATAGFISTRTYQQIESNGVLPSLHISIYADDIDRDEWSDVAVSLTGASRNFEFEEVSAQVRGRGNSTWHSMGEKRPYRIRFDEARPMFGSDYVARDWTLLANAKDYTMLRNYSAYSLGRMLMDFGPAGHFVHLYLNGEYRGVYMLSDQTQVLEGRVDLTYNSIPNLSEFLIEWDNRARPDRNNDFDFFISGNIHFTIEYPSGQNLTDGHINYAQEIIHDMDTLLFRGDYHEIRQVLDVESFIDYYIVQELFRNADVGASSLFFQIRQTDNGPKVFAGPIWDFDFSSGAGLPPDTDPIEYQPYGAWAGTRNRWFWALLETDWFRPMVAERWLEIRDAEVRIMLDRIWELSGTYQEEFERNFERWPEKLGQNLWRTSPSVVAIPDYMGNVEFLVDWLERRIDWFNEFLEVNY